MLAGLKREITIVGGGLAGLSLGVGLLKRGLAVTLVEAGQYPRHRVCGEFISGVSDATLDVLGISEAFHDAPRHRRLSWFRQDRKWMSRELPEAAVAISRYRLDDRLANIFQKQGGKLITASRRPRRATEGMVWSAGRMPQKSPWLGLKCHLVDFPMDDGLEMHLGRGGYVGLTPVEDGRVNLCGLFEVECGFSGRGRDLMRQYLQRGGQSALIERLDAAQIVESSFSAVAGFQLGWQPVDDGVCCVGDACGMIPPFTGNGMSMAFESAEMAIGPLVAWQRGDAAWSDTVATIHREARRRFRRRMQAAMTIHRLLLNTHSQRFLETLAQGKLLPFRPLLSLIR